MGKGEHSSGFVSLHRSILRWGWYKNANTSRLFIHLLLTAEYKARCIHGKSIKRGQRLCSVENLAVELGLSIRQTRTALEHLKSTGEVTTKTSPQGTVITVKNYVEYQTATNDMSGDRQTTDKQVVKQTTNKRQTTDKPTSNKEINNNIPPISPKGDEYSSDFLEFWEEYPKGRKRSKPTAWRAWKKLRPDAALRATILNALRKHSQSADWLKDGGQFIPYPATWLNQRRWEDEIDDTEEDDSDVL